MAPSSWCRGLAIVGRLPVFIDGGSGKQQFWGFAIAVVRLERLHEALGLDYLSRLGYAYRVSGFEPFAGTQRVVWGWSSRWPAAPVWETAAVLDTEWEVGVAPLSGRGSIVINAGAGGTAVFVSVLLGLLTFESRRRESYAAASAALLGRVAAHVPGALFYYGRNPDGKPCFGSDVSEHKAAEEALKVSEQRLAATVENTPNVAIQWLSPGGRVVYWNRASERLYGWTAEEALGKTLGQLMVTREQEQEFHEILKRLEAGGGAHGPAEFTVTRRDGERATIASTVFEIPGQEMPIFVCMDVDVTRRRRAETELAESKELAEAANEAKSAFLLGMSHELRTPRSAVVGFADILGQGDEPLSPGQAAAVAHIREAGGHLVRLVDALLDLQRIEAGRLELAVDNVGLLDAAGETIALVAPQASSRGIAVHLSECEDLSVRADPSRLRQVLLNLLSNAVKYNRDGGSVSVLCRESGGRVRVSVSDTGHGIPSELQNLLFRPFQRLGGGMGGSGGVGIGLSICKKLVVAMGGSIGYERLANGSRFWFTLPAGVDQGRAHGRTKPVVAVGGLGNSGICGRVLCVDDHPGNLRLMQQIFRRQPGIELLVAESAEEALAQIHAAPPDLVLMDIHMEGMSGDAAMRLLKSDPTTARIPVVAVSADAMPDSIGSALAAGFAAYVTKPIDIPRLIEVVEGLLGRQVTA